MSAALGGQMHACIYVSDGDVPSSIREQPSPSSIGSLSNRTPRLEEESHEALTHTNMDIDRGWNIDREWISTEGQPAGTPHELEVGIHAASTRTEMDIEPRTPPRQEPPRGLTRNPDGTFPRDFCDSSPACGAVLVCVCGAGCWTCHNSRPRPPWASPTGDRGVLDMII